MLHSTEIYIELYKRKQFDKIPVFEDDAGLYYLSKKQIQALNLLHDNTTFYIGYGGSGNSGKTLLECFYVMFQCLSYDDVRYMIGRSELKNLKATTIQTLLKVFKFYGLERDVDYFYNDKESYYYFKNGSRIICRDTKYYPSDPEMTDLGGLEITGAVLDESVENKEIVVNILTSRVGRWNNKKYGIPAKILEGFNPAKNHVNYRYWRPFRDGKETLERKFVRALSSDNPNPEAREWEKKILMTGDKITIQRLLHGNFDYDDDDNALCNFDKIHDIFTNSFVKDEGQMFMSCDVAISNDYFVVIVWRGLRIKEIVRIRNISPTQIETRSDNVVNNKIDFQPLLDIFIKLSEKWNVPRSNIIYDGDGLGHKLIKLIPGAVPIFNNSRSIGNEYSNLKCQLEFKLAQMINNAEIYCEANLTTDLKEAFIEELQMIKRSTEPGEKLATMKKSIIKELLGRSPDIMDAVKYRLLFLLTRNS